MTTAIEKFENHEIVTADQFSAFGSLTHFETAQRMAKALSTSSIVPETYRGPEKIGDCVIALEISNRIGATVLAVMQNLYIVHGRPAWSSQFLISCLNASRRFTPLRYKMTGNRGDDSWGCIAWASDRSGEVLEGPEVTIGMSKAEGWYGRNGSKWKTMPELMMRYRAATFFTRLYAPEITMGIQTDDEVVDVQAFTVQSPATPSRQLFAPAPPAALVEPLPAISEVKKEEKPAAEKAADPLTPQQDFARFINTDCGVMFDDFVDFVANKNLAIGWDSWLDWDGVPASVIESLRSPANAKNLAELIRKFGTKAVAK